MSSMDLFVRPDRLLALTLALAIATPATAQQRELQLLVLDGRAAHNAVGAKQSKPVTVEVRENGKPVEGARVRFVLPEFGPGGRFADGTTEYSVHTNDTGVASMPPYRPNAKEGRFTMVVDAAYGGRTVSAAVEQSNVALDMGVVGHYSQPRLRSTSRASSKLLLLLGLGAAVGIGAGFASRGGGGRTGTPTTVSVGGVGIGGFN